ncbi:RNA pyrophosphohydrolase [Azospirillum agricola]|uniref:RNA pyrophosphohydrolase n=1 Tax=Azospirillum agricola TaxID=1720247 RepID=UPI000A0F19B7|nr:RNA pyrophosphohydrolase [Azospirillum agricola]SMH54359.1 putative (di)nucleoside polyphosphate hydrolase [Azospirillum lipoferum]
MKTPTGKTPIDRASLPYRPCVGIMLLNGRGEVFVARRTGSSADWQMPQGGIDKGEDARAAAFREMEEEIGTAKAEFIAMTVAPHRYDLPDDLLGKVWKGRWRGQEQMWMLARFTGVDSDIRLDTAHPEFDAWRWIDAEELPGLIVAFKRPVYESVLAEFRPLIGARTRSP